ncbi:hypothetical protein [Fluviispira multicolorata]|uniref:Polymer-forming protein n=1 Tax=Fluviispira multicolorata TaxID=2654512 RepID=A0A833JA62_9BACT|nr:hypothetical protein [Fluviispira multicolorata]KAB8027394.1 hypothetical protein GCL57_14455 [Fluviispira multicolorata]
MKNIFLILSAILTIFIMPISMASNFDNGSTIFGPLVANATTYDKQIKVLGPVKSTDSIFNGELKILGPIEAINSKINKNSEIYGDIKFTNSTATAKIVTKGKTNHFLNGSSLKDLTLLKPDFGSQTVLIDNSIVNGDIKFEKEGEVILRNNGKVTGNVINGKIITN